MSTSEPTRCVQCDEPVNGPHITGCPFDPAQFEQPKSDEAPAALGLISVLELSIRHTDPTMWLETSAGGLTPIGSSHGGPNADYLVDVEEFLEFMHDEYGEFDAEQDLAELASINAAARIAQDMGCRYVIFNSRGIVHPDVPLEDAWAN